MKHIIAVILVCIAHMAQAQVNHKVLYEAYLAQDFQVWKTAIDQSQSSQMTIKQIEDIINYEYGYVAVCLGAKNTEEAERVMQFMERQLDLLEQHQYQPAVVNLYRSVLYAFKIPSNKWDVVSLATKSVKCAQKAYEHDPKNPLVVNLQGNVDFFRPKLFGGSKKNALYNYEKAVELFEQQNQTTHNWNYLATLLSMAQAYEKTGNLQKADLICQKILQIAPNFKYLNEVYYPQLLEKIEQNRLNPSPQCRDVACRVSTTNTVGDLTVQTERAPSLPNNVFLQTFAH